MTPQELRETAARETWWHQRDPDSPGIFWGPTYVGMTHAGTDAEWLAQAFREAVSRVHQYGVNEPPDPMNALAQRALDEEPDHPNADEIRRQMKPHINVEDADYNCEHPFCVRWWPMVRAAEARAKLELAGGGTE
jgi:hypothetical protein